MLDQAFENIFNQITGFSPKEFQFLLSNGYPNPQIPFSTFWWPLSSTIGYFVMIVSVQHIMKDRKALNLRSIAAVHNILLSIFSALLLFLIVQNLIPLWSQGLYASLCAPDGYPNFTKLQLLYYINYLFKYYELLDTLFLVLSKKKLEFLHYYHHSATVWLTYSQIAAKSTMQWVPITLNLAVHILMYYYYFATAMGKKVWWKKYLTSFQIIQFVIDLIFVYSGSVMWFIGEYYPHLWPGITCNAQLVSVSAGSGILSSYLLLFLQFFVKTYKRTSMEKKVE